jgi:DNA-binding MarR family transcriptional regulator
VDLEACRALAGFHRGLRQFLAASDEAARAAGVTALQSQALLAVKAAQAGRIALGDLARELMLKSNAAVQMVDRLEAQALVLRVPSRTDGRVVDIELTPEGEGLIGALAATHLDHLARRKKPLADLLRRLKRAP